MTRNLLVTGPPRSGKTTVLERVRDRLEERGHVVGGVYCPELRSDGDRVGFEIVDLATGESRVLAHVDREVGPSVGNYRVNVEGVDEVCASALAPREVLLVDEVAPMELYSDEFVRGVRRALDGDVALVAAVHRGTDGFVGEVKGRDDVELFEVTPETREELPARLERRVREWL